MPRHDSDAVPWRAIFDDQRRSGLTQAEFCRRRGLSLHAFRKRLYARPDPGDGPAVDAPGPGPAPRFLPVTLVADAHQAAPPAAEALVLILDGRARIAVAPGFDPETLRRLVDAIGPRT